MSNKFNIGENSFSETVPIYRIALLYVGITIITNIFFALVVSFVSVLLFNTEPPRDLGVGTAFGSIYASSYYILSRFQNKHGRLLSPPEYKRLTRFGALTTSFFSIPLLALVLLNDPDMTVKEQVVLFLIVVIMVGLIQWMMSCVCIKSIMRFKQISTEKNDRVPSNKL